jgi:RNA polymerase sigma-70 factor, ECF subfamily
VISTETDSPPRNGIRLTDSDEDLYLRIGAGPGEQAFKLLYERHASRVFAYCSRILGNRDAAKDAFQETFIRLYQKAVQNLGPLRVAPYLYAIAHNVCITSIRSRKHNVPIDEYTLHDEDRSLEHTERGELVRLAIELLPMDYREPLILHEYNDVSYADIAEIIGIPVSTVKIRIFRAKEKLRAILAPYFK